MHAGFDHPFLPEDGMSSATQILRDERGKILEMLGCLKAGTDQKEDSARTRGCNAITPVQSVRS